MESGYNAISLSNFNLYRSSPCKKGLDMKWVRLTFAMYYRIKFALSLIRQGYKWEEIKEGAFQHFEYEYWYGNKEE